MTADLARRASAEAVGTALLVAIVVGSGIAAQRLSPGDIGLQLLENSIATGAGLVALILAFGPVSGAHFNPVVTLADRILGGTTNARRRRLRRRADRRRVRRRDGRQPHVRPRRRQRLDAHALERRAVARRVRRDVRAAPRDPRRRARRARRRSPPFAVGGYIAAAYWFTSSTSFANPAVTIGRTLTDTLRRHRAEQRADVHRHADSPAGSLAVALGRSWNPDIPADGSRRTP